MTKPTKLEEYKAFLKIVKNDQVSNWGVIAQALGVNPDTITDWKRQPEAREAIAEGIQKALKNMETAGSKDWRMWEAKLKMLGVNPPSKVDVKSDKDPIEALLIAYGIKEGPKDDGQADATVPRPSENKT